jgi:type VI protein secretion system component VasK
MNQRTKDLWVIPIFISLATGIVLGAIFMFLGPWLTGTSSHPSFSLRWLKLALFVFLPVWVTLLVLLVAVILSGLFLRQRARTAEETERKKHLEDQIAKLNKEHQAEIEMLNTKEPTLHGVWNNSQTF